MQASYPGQCYATVQENLPIHQLTHLPIAVCSPLAFIHIGADAILRRRDRIVRESVGVDSVALWIAALFIRRLIAFDRAFVAIRIG